MVGRAHPGTLRRLASVWRTGAELLDSLEVRPEGESVLHLPRVDDRIHAAVADGELVSVDIRLLDRDAEFHLHGRIVGRTLRHGRRGLRVALLEEERDRRELVLLCARGQSVPYFRRRYPRVPCCLPAWVAAPHNEEFETTVVTIAEGGAGLTLVSDAIWQDAMVTVSIEFEAGASPLALRSRVASIRRAGLQAGIGVEFLFESREREEALHRHVARIRRRAAHADDGG